MLKSLGIMIKDSWEGEYMLSKIVSIGDRIELKKINTSNKNNNSEVEMEKTYISQVYDILSETRLSIAMPIVESRVIPLETKIKYDLFFITSGGLYQCVATIVERYKEDGLFVMIIELLSDLNKRQRRQYYRLECNLSFRYRVLLDEEVDFFIQNPDFISAEGMFTSATAVDISGGGMKFISSEKLMEEDKILLVLELEFADKKYEINILATVKLADAVKNKIGVYESRIEFENLKMNIRETLIRYIFEQERIQRKRIKD